MADELETSADASTIRMLSRLLEEGGPAGPAPGSRSLRGGGRLMSSTEQLSPSVDERQPRRRTKTVSERMERLEAGLRTRVEAMPPEERPDEEQVREIIGNARSGLQKWENGRKAEISEDEAVSLEGVVMTDGTRPSLLVANGFTDLKNSDVGDWYGILDHVKDGLRAVIAAVGRIRVQGALYGTGFVIGRDDKHGLIITNRHVLEKLAKLVDGGKQWVINKPNTVIDLVGEHGSNRSTTFTISGVRFAGPDPTGNGGLDVLDLAVLEVDLQSDKTFPFPKAVKFASHPVPLKRNLCVIGFPARPEQLDNNITKIFGTVFGVKRLAPGEVDFGIGEHEGDSKKWVFVHDASTLRGNSGSCVVDLGVEGTPVIGIHFGGKMRIENYAHAAAALQTELREQGAAFV